jgi:anti-anti-sigma regulatory factor
MGLFSFLKKKNEDTGAGLLMPDTRLRAGEPSRLDEAERARQREIARATAAKIDEIELEMASSMFDDEPAWGSQVRHPAAAPATPPADTAVQDEPDAAAAPAIAPAVEESAILYANGQAPLAEQLLRDCLPTYGRHERLPWWMLFDLYQATGREQDFESIAIDYASHFETSPPTWTPPAVPSARAHTYAGVTPTETLSGRLDAGCAVQTERLLQLAGQHPVLRLELGRIADVTPEGCAVLAQALARLRASGAELIVAGAAELAELVSASIEIGRRDAPQAPWLLLLELLQLMNREKDFEETAMDYCITYEVSPPSFAAPAKVATAANAHAPAATDRFMLPPSIGGEVQPLFDAIDAYAQGVGVLLLDCSRLARIDYAAAGALLSRLRPLAQTHRIELRDLNHLVAALLKLLGYTEVARLFPHKY